MNSKSLSSGAFILSEHTRKPRTFLSTRLSSLRSGSPAKVIESCESGGENGLLERVDIIDRRNEYAVEGVLRSTVDHRVLYWGAAHLSGMVKLLRENGYSITDEGWRVVLPASYKVPEQ